MKYLQLLLFALLTLQAQSDFVVNDGDYSSDSLECKGALDLGIIFDVSVSILPKDFNSLKKSLSEFISHFTIGPNALRVGLIPFETEIHTDEGFTLDRYTTSAEVANHILNLPHIGIKLGRDHATTDTYKALRYVRETLLAPGVTRPGIARACLVMTDGNSQETSKTKSEAALLRDSGVEVYAVGYGNDISVEKLLNIAGDPSRVTLVKNLGDLNATLSQLSVNICEEIPLANEEPGCVERDVVFVFSQVELGGASIKVARMIEEMSLLTGTVNFRYGIRTDVCAAGPVFALSHDVSSQLTYLRRSYLSAVVEHFRLDSPFGKDNFCSPRCEAVVLVSNKAVGLQGHVDMLRETGASQVFVWNLSPSDLTVHGAEMVSGSAGRSAARAAEYVIRTLS